LVQTFKKVRKSRLKKFTINTNNQLHFGILGLKAVESGIINKNQIESARKILIKKTNRKIKIWINLAFNYSVTAKSLGTRMGKGKGKITHICSKVSSGSTIFEILGNNKKILVNALKCSKIKLPIKTVIF
jgi:large subunit ribosomal protein L16